MLDVVQIIGALLVLAAFTGSQMGRLPTDALSYLWLNLVGSVVLAALALHEEQWGFLLLEACWGAVAAWGLVHRGRGRGLTTG